MIQSLKAVRHVKFSTMKQAANIAHKADGGCLERLQPFMSVTKASELSVPVPWGQIRGKVWGPEHGRPVLCLHGWSDNCGTFNSLIPLLPKECRYVAVDLAGHGLSSHRRPGESYYFPSYVMDVRRVVDALQLKKFSIIGHSMGGNVAGLFSALHPDMVEAVALLDSTGFLPTNMKEMPEAMRQGFDEIIHFDKRTKERKKKVYTYENAVQRLMSGNPSLSEQSLHILLERGLVHVEGGVVFSRDLAINLKNVVRPTLDLSLEMQSRIQAPVLVVFAESGFEKVSATPDQKEFISALLQVYRDRNDMVVTVPGDHHVHLNNPEVVAPVVSDFLQSKVLSQSAGVIDEQITSKL